MVDLQASEEFRSSFDIGRNGSQSSMRFYDVLAKPFDPPSFLPGVDQETLIIRNAVIAVHL